MRADAFLAGSHQMDRQQPFMQGDMAILEDRLNRNGELLFAALALPQTLLSFADALPGPDHLDHLLFGLLFADDAACLADDATVRADRTFRSAHGFEVFSRLVFVLTVRFEDGTDFVLARYVGLLLHAPNIRLFRRVCQVNNYRIIATFMNFTDWGWDSEQNCVLFLGCSL